MMIVHKERVPQTKVQAYVPSRLGYHPVHLAELRVRKTLADTENYCTMLVEECPLTGDVLVSGVVLYHQVPNSGTH